MPLLNRLVLALMPSLKSNDSAVQLSKLSVGLAIWHSPYPTLRYGQTILTSASIQIHAASLSTGTSFSNCKVFRTAACGASAARRFGKRIMLSSPMFQPSLPILSAICGSCGKGWVRDRVRHQRKYACASTGRDHIKRGAGVSRKHGTSCMDEPTH